MIERRSSIRLDLETRNQRILMLYQIDRLHRKRIAIIMNMQYDAVKKVIQKYHESMNDEIVSHNESCEVGYLHSER